LSGSAIVELQVRNADSRSYFIPISRSVETLYENDSDNQNRREFFWGLYLRSQEASEETFVLGLATYRSSRDARFAFELRPQESITVRFGVNLSEAWRIDSAKWREGIAKGAVTARARLYETTLDRRTAAKREYYGYSSEPVLTNNSVQLSLQP
jgi:RimJ/RimL family protein N-acetyltransferase